MKIQNTKYNKTYTPQFKALKVARIHSYDDNISDTFIYSIDKNKDNNFCNKLWENLRYSNDERMPIQTKNIKNFIKNAFSSISRADETAIAVKDNKPFGILTVFTYEKDTLAHLAYLATWKNQNLQKVKNGGSMLINHLFCKHINKREINLTPAFASDTFYFRFGFEYENEYDTNHMFIDKKEISKQVEKLKEKFTYQKILDEKSVNLENIIKFK